MTLTTHIRFTERIDPRAVWETAQKLVGVPEDYRWDFVPTGADRWQLNDEFRVGHR